MVNEKCLKVPVLSAPHTSGVARKSLSQVRFVDVFAGGYWSMAQAVSGEIYAWGLNNYHQLGITREDEGMEDLMAICVLP